jgi:hypothetical protein
MSERRSAVDYESTHLKQVHIQKFANQELDLTSNLSICLWGPPGCGKSSAKVHLENLLRVDTLLVFNRDDWNEFIAAHYFRDEYTYLMDERRKRSERKGGDGLESFRSLSDETIVRSHNQIFVSSDEELAFWRELMTGSYNQLRQKAGNTLPDDIYDIYFEYFLTNLKITLERADFMEFIDLWHKGKYPENVFDAGICTILYRFGPWWARLKEVHFLLELSGNTFNQSNYIDMFGTSNNLLYIPFIDDLDILKSRVSHRNQFGSPNISQLPEFYANSYGTNLLKALQSRMFSQIIIQGNSKLNYVMLSLERVNDEYTGINYILVKELANNYEEALYIKAILQALFIPDHMHAHNNLIYTHGRWSLVDVR